jgi:hypothetical protein
VIDRLEAAVTFDERRGYVGSAPDLPQPIVALSLGGLRRSIEIALMLRRSDIRLILDRAARLERDQRRRGPRGGCRRCPRSPTSRGGLAARPAP